VKKYICLFGIIITQLIFCSCKKENSTEPEKPLQKITVGYIAGNNGTIYRSSDEGKTWDTLHSGVTNKLNSVFSLNIYNTWIVGDGGLILRTTNSGINWVSQNSGTSFNLKQIFIDTVTNRSWIAGDGGTILFSSNGGDDWNAKR